ncbi:MAG: glutathione S-transferase N-terminal domain-containing protein [Pseudomonadales bacterium]|nr:glutathione S-transferase N-terminal domain-containing protein [Pseudomonadales bacterium]
MTLLSDPSSHYSHRVRIVLAEKGVTCDIIDTDGKNLPADLVDVNPYGSLPTLLDRDLVLYESKVIMEYLDERFPHPPLLPVYPVARGESRLYIYRIERDWCALIDAIESGRASDAEKLAKDLADGFVGIAPIFADKPFFMSEEFTLVDCCLGPILWRLESLGVKLPNNKQVKPLLEYMKRLFDMESFQESLSEIEREMRPNR